MINNPVHEVTFAGVVHNKHSRFKSFCTRLLVPPNPEELGESLAHWYQSPYGSRLLEKEKLSINKWLPRFNGYRAMQVSVGADLDLLVGSSMLHKFALSNLSIDSHMGARCDFDALPLPSQLIDAVVLHHVLDYCVYPHEALKEATRVISPSGYIAIVGFNPYSWLGLAKLPLQCFTDRPVWKHRNMSAYRVVDWLTLLGFRIEAVDYEYFSLPIQYRKFQSLRSPFDWLGKKLSLPFGAFYTIIARKQMVKPLDNHQVAWLPKAISPRKLTEPNKVQVQRQKKSSDERSGNIY